jgi:hypothetical protein
MIGTDNMQPIYIKKFKKFTVQFILSGNKNCILDAEIRCIMRSHKNCFDIYIDKNLESYFNLYPSKGLKLQNIISVNQSIKSLSLIDFNCLLTLIDDVNNTPLIYHREHTSNLINVLQLVLAKWDDWN